MRTIYIYLYNAENNSRRNFYYNETYYVRAALLDLKLIVRLCNHLVFLLVLLFSKFFIFIDSFIVCDYLYNLFQA